MSERDRLSDALVEMTAQRDALAESSDRNFRDLLNEAIRLKGERLRYKAQRDALAAKVADQTALIDRISAYARYRAIATVLRSPEHNRTWLDLLILMERAANPLIQAETKD